MRQNRISKMADQKEKKYRRIGWISSIVTQVVLLILFYFLVAWREPFPPIPSYGIELSFGVEETGRGDVPVSNPEPETEENEVAEEVTEEPVEEVSPEEVLPEEETVEETSEAEAAETVETPVTEIPSPDVTDTETEQVKTEAPVKDKEEPRKERPVEKAEESSALNPSATMPTADESSEVNETKGTTETEGSEGKEDGTIDGRALMGEQGSSNGASLSLAGWGWVSPPDPKDESDESGKIVYKIKVDDEGYLIGIELLTSTVSPVVERYYRQSVEKLEFYKTSSQQSAPVSTGTITFIIRAK